MDDIPARNAANNNEEIAYWLALLRTPGVGNRGIRKLLAQAQTPSALFNAYSSTSLSTLGLKKAAQEYLLNPDWSCIEKDLAWLDQPDNHSTGGDVCRFIGNGGGDESVHRLGSNKQGNGCGK